MRITNPSLRKQPAASVTTWSWKVWRKSKSKILDGKDALNWLPHLKHILHMYRSTHTTDNAEKIFCWIEKELVIQTPLEHRVCAPLDPCKSQSGLYTIILIWGHQRKADYQRWTDSKSLILKLNERRHNIEPWLEPDRAWYETDTKRPCRTYCYWSRTYLAKNLTSLGEKLIRSSFFSSTSLSTRSKAFLNSK